MEQSASAPLPADTKPKGSLSPAPAMTRASNVEPCRQPTPKSLTAPRCVNVSEDGSKVVTSVALEDV